MHDARLRLPREPYPGLRPYMDFEAPLLFGRDLQVDEIVQRLAATQFVAVLGGSGSGKSSLVIAGVVPRLRSYGIPGAGDLWLPMTCTPGTNTDSPAIAHHDAAAGAPPQAPPAPPAPRTTPVTRLAHRFAALLSSRGNAEADGAREVEIAAVLRQEMGLARLLDAYTPELAVAPGLDAADARVLIVLDQFEEVFHPTNRGVPDADALVQCVMDHCIDPHPRCHVVLTMRSEFLNHCATYLELPDAINRSSYLVRRLAADELRAAIAGPAQRFLRLLARSAAVHDAQALPAQVQFEPAVVERLLRDVSSIADDPDHLPLLQHALARVWQAALERGVHGQQVPAQITLADLARAVNPQAQANEPTLQPDLNVLRACIENWPEALYQHLPEEKRQHLMRLIPRLGIKDIYTGTYTQQRLNVDDGARLLGAGKTRTDLRDVVSSGFIGSVDYFFWDSSDPQMVTLKVSHESLIRGWLRFRAVVDTESVHFEEYLTVLRKCADWVNQQRHEDLLLGTGEMRRLDGTGFLQRLKDGAQRDTWTRLLGLERHAQRLLPAAAEMDAYLKASERRQVLLRQRETRVRRGALALVGLTLALWVVPAALFNALVQGPTMQRAGLLFEAGNRANQALLKGNQESMGDGAGTLQSMLLAGALVDQARTGAGPWRTTLSKGLLDRAGSWPFFGDQKDFLDQVFMQAEPPVNGTLRRLMQGALWRAPPPGSADAADEVLLPAPTVTAQASCAQESGKPGTGPTEAQAAAARAEALTGRLFVQRRDNSADTRSLRALFVPNPSPADSRGALDVWSASVDPITRECVLGTIVLSIPEQLNTSLVFDASLRLFFYTVDRSGNAPSSLIVQEMDWERGSDGLVQVGQRQTLTTLSDPAGVAAVKAATGPLRVAVAQTWRAPGARVVEIQGKRWLLVNAQAQRVDLAAAQRSGLKALKPAEPGSACAVLSKTFAEVPGFGVQFFEQGGQCFSIARGRPATRNDGEGARPLRDEVRVAVHEKPGPVMLQRASENPPAPLATMAPFASTAPASGTEGALGWFVGRAGPWDGWLLMRTETDPADAPGSGDTHRFVGLPWSTCALWRVGRSLRQHNPAPDAGAYTATSMATTCQEP